MKKFNQGQYIKLIETISSMKDKVSDVHIRLLLDNCYSLTIDSLELHNVLLEKYGTYIKVGASDQEKSDLESKILLKEVKNVDKENLVAINLLQLELTMKRSMDDIKNSANNLSYEHYTSMTGVAIQSLFDIYEGIAESKNKSYLKLIAAELAKLEPIGKSCDIWDKIKKINTIEINKIIVADSALVKWKTYFSELFKWCSHCNLIILMLSTAIKHQESINKSS